MLRVYLLLLAVFFLAPSCAAIDGGSDNGAIPMPERFLGNWRAHNIEVDISMIIKPDIIIHQSYDSGLIRRTEEYKVFYKDNKYVYAIVAEKDTTEWLKKSLNLTDQEIKEKKYDFPEYVYKRYSVEFYTNGIDMINVYYQDCNLTAKDWNLPLSVHTERLKIDFCQNIDKYNTFQGPNTWTKYTNNQEGKFSKVCPKDNAWCNPVYLP